jgi:acyl-CoA thioesterase FadM
VNLYFRLLWLRIVVRFRSRLSIWGTSRTRFRVLPTDLDLLGHMNNGKYLTIMDLGRMDLMIRSGFWKLIDEHGWYPVVAAQTITYRRSLQPWQRFEVVTRIIGHDDRASYMEQRFVVGEKVYARAVVQARFLKKTGGTVTQQELLDAAEPAPDGLELPAWVHEWAGHVRIV